MLHSIDIPDDLGPLSPAQLSALLVSIDAHLRVVYPARQRVELLASAQAQSEALADAYAEATADDAPTPWAKLTDRVGPGQRVIWTDGNTWRNTSKAWLPITATPATWPQGWAQETGLPPSVLPWVAGEQVWKAGDPLDPNPAKTATLRTYGGLTYRALQSHTTQATWTPPIVPALWAPQT